jgi:DNA modification methylase
LFISPTHCSSTPLTSLRPYLGNARTHSKGQIRQIADSIERFGFTNPVLISAEGEIIAGHGRVEAARLLGLEIVPTILLDHLNEAERRAYGLADNKLALNSSWDDGVLAAELGELEVLGIDLEWTGFSQTELDEVLGSATVDFADDVDELPEVGPERRVVPGDVWQLGKHRLICGDARDPAVLETLLSGEKVDMIFTDPPYNLSKRLRGRAKVRHKPFVMAAGELDKGDYTEFLSAAFHVAAAHAQPGAIAFVCMDWRHMGELLSAGDAAFHELKNLCVWNKQTGGLGTFYRSQHELVFVFKVRAGKHINNFALGGEGRYRTNVWDYAGVNGFRAGRGDDLAAHPTVKPVAMVADAIKDCSSRGGIVLDTFAGSGSTLLAAELTQRRAHAVEIEPVYCDLILARFSSISKETPALLSRECSVGIEEASRD